jgi:dolichol-phosphate mannosyltransferase
LPGGCSPHKNHRNVIAAAIAGAGTTMSTRANGAIPAVSVVVPVRNEAGNIAPLVAEIAAALADRWRFEIVYVNDGSTDGTDAELSRLMTEHPFLRHVRHARSCGQSAAVRTGVAAARAPVVVTLDGDGQNDPAFIPALLQGLEAATPRAGLVAGQRVGRKDTGFKRLQSRVANAVRNAVLKDGTRDTGCGLKAFERDVFLALPYFDGLHRFLPALVRREGRAIGYVDVVDRPRRHGVSNYGFFDRLWVGILDLLGVWWLVRRRKRVPQATEIERC